MQCGVIEVVPDSKSRDQIGKETDITLHQYFIQTYGEESSLEFQSVSLEFKKKNFFLYPSKGLLIWWFAKKLYSYQHIISSPDPKGHVRYCHNLAPVVIVYVHWMVLQKVYVFFGLIGSTQKKQETQMCQRGCCQFLISFFETNGPIGSEVSRYVHWMVL